MIDIPMPDGESVRSVRTVSTYIAYPHVPGPGVVVLQTAWGLRQDYIHDVARLFDLLQHQGTPATWRIYPGTGRCFAEPSMETYVPEAAEAAWQATLTFLRTYLASP
jgi:dienelactone hydrolase